jgi:hypothetical protein
VSLIVDIEMVNCCCFVAIIDGVSMSNVYLSLFKMQVNLLLPKQPFLALLFYHRCRYNQCLFMFYLCLFIIVQNAGEFVVT